MIADLEFKSEKDETRSYWRFSVVYSDQGHLVHSRGWRYWPASRSVKPPMVNKGKFWIMKATAGEYYDLVRDRVEQAIAQKNSGEVQTDENALFELYLALDKLSPERKRPEPIFEFRRSFPQLARKFFICSLDEELKGLFEDLPEGRLWPDEYLKKKAQDVKDSIWTVDDLVEHEKLGIFSKADFKRIYEFLGGR